MAEFPVHQYEVVLFTVGLPEEIGRTLASSELAEQGPEASEMDADRTKVVLRTQGLDREMAARFAQARLERALRRPVGLLSVQRIVEETTGPSPTKTPDLRMSAW